MFSGVASTVINTGVTFISFPLYLHYLGYEKYGVWLVLSTVISFVQLSSLGMGPAVTKLVAEEYGRGDTKSIQAYVTTAFLILMIMGMLALIVLLFFGEEILSLFKLGTENTIIGLKLLPFMGLLTVYVFVVQIFSGTLSGLGRMDQVNYRDSICRVIALIASIAMLYRGLGIVSLLIGNAVSSVFMHVTSVVLVRRIIRVPVIRFSKWDMGRFRNLLRFGSAIFGGSLISMLFSPFNKLMLSRYAGVSSIPIYEIAFTGTMQIRGLIESGLRALMPEISRISSDIKRNGIDRISQLYRNSMKIIIFAGIPLYGLLALLSPWLLRIWLGESFVESIPGVFRIMLISTFISLMGVPAYYLLMGLGHVRKVFTGTCITSFSSLFFVLLIGFITKNLTPFIIGLCLIPAWTMSTVFLILTFRLYQKVYPIHENENEFNLIF